MKNKFLVTMAAILISLLIGIGAIRTSAQVPPVGPTVCVANCGPYNTGGSSGGSTAPSGPTPQQLLQQREQAMHDANDRGAEFFNRGDWASAIRFFQEALEQSPDDPVILGNLRRAQAKAREEAESARAHGQAAGSMSLERASEEARKVFDTPGARAPTSGDVVDTRGLGRRIQIPASLANHQEIRRWQTQRNAFADQLRSLDNRLELIRQKKAQGGGNRGEMDVQETNTKKEIGNVTNQIGALDVQMESFVIDMTRKRKSTPKR